MHSLTQTTFLGPQYQTNRTRPNSPMLLIANVKILKMLRDLADAVYLPRRTSRPRQNTKYDQNQNFISQSVIFQTLMHTAKNAA